MEQTPTRSLTLARALALTPLLCTLASAAQDTGTQRPTATPPERAADKAQEVPTRAEDDLAALRLEAQVDGLDAALSKLRARLDALMEEAQTPSSAARPELEGRIAAYWIAELEMLRDAGDLKRAWLSAFRFLQLDGSPGPALDIARAQLSVAPVLRSVFEPQGLVGRTYVDKAIREQELQDAQSEAKRIVRDAIEQKDYKLLERLGASVTDVYAELARDATHPTVLLKHSPGPLRFLLVYAPENAIEVARELVARPGPGWRAAVAAEFAPEPPAVNLLVAVLARGSEELSSLFDTLLASDELTSKPALQILIALSRAGAEGPRLERAIEKAMPQLTRRDAFSSNGLLPLARQWIGSADPARRRIGIDALFRSATLTTGDLAALAADPNHEIRQMVAQNLAEITRKEVDLTAAESALWMTLLNDSSPEVRRDAYGSLETFLQSRGRSPMTAAQIEEFVQRIASPDEAELLGSLPDALPSIVEWAKQTTATVPERAQIFNALLRSPWPKVRVALIEWLLNSDRRPSLMIELLRGFVPQQGADDGELQGQLSSLLYFVHRGSNEERNLGYAQLIQHGEPHRGWALAIASGLKEISFTALDSQLAVDALRAMVTADPDRVAQALYGTNWTAHAATLKSAAARADLAQLERIVLNAARTAASPAEVAPRAAVLAALEGLTQVDGSSLGLPIAWASSALTKDPAASLALLGELLASPRLPDEAFGTYASPNASAEGYPRALALPVVDALERRVIAAGEGAAPRFSYMQFNLLKAMVADPTLYRPRLARNWLREQTQHEDLARAAHFAGDQEMVDIVRERLVANVANFSGTLGQSRSVLDSLLAVPGEATAQSLAEIAVSTQSQDMRKEIVERLETIASARELGARLRRASTPEADRGRAVTETLALLADTNEAVRVQAIRGLATLGAVEQVPRLVKLVGEGSAAEKKAALEALDLLHRRAASEEQE